jgi:uncharacterized OB-fold protein
MAEREEADAARGPEEQFREFLRQGRFLVQRARTSGRVVFYPRVAEPGTGERDLEWVPCRGAGTVYATTVIRRRPEKGGDYNVALIDVDDGFRMLSRVEATSPDDVTIGQRVQARISEIDGEPAIVFDPLNSPGEADHAG